MWTLGRGSFKINLKVYSYLNVTDYQSNRKNQTEAESSLLECGLVKTNMQTLRYRRFRCADLSGQR